MTILQCLHPAPAVTVDQAAQLTQVSEATIHRAVAVKAVAPELHEAMKEGKVSTNDAYKVKDAPAPVRQEALSKLTAGKVGTLSEGVRVVNRENAREQMKQVALATPLSDKFTLYTSPIATLHNSVERGSIDIIITDPPYPKEFLHCWRELGDFASYALKPEGLLLALSGSINLPDVLKELDHPNLWFRTVIGHHKQGPPVMSVAHRIASYMKYILVYHKYPAGTLVPGDGSRAVYEPVINYSHMRNFISVPQDPIEGDTGHQAFHKWGQSTKGFARIIEEFAYPGAVICDPFLGGGTTGIAALQANHPFIGADIDPENVEISRGRLLSL